MSIREQVAITRSTLDRNAHRWPHTAQSAVRESLDDIDQLLALVDRCRVDLKEWAQCYPEAAANLAAEADDTTLGLIADIERIVGSPQEEGSVDG